MKEGWPIKLYGEYDEEEQDWIGIGKLFRPVVADLNNDNLKEIIIYKSGKPPKLYVYDYQGEILPNYPIEVEPNSGRDGHPPFPVVGDINNDGYNEIVIIRPKNWDSSCADPPCILIYNYNGDLLDKFDVSYPGFSYPNWCGDFASGHQSLTLADLNHNGNLEIIIQGEMAITILDNQGNTLDNWPKHMYGWIGGSHVSVASVGNMDADDDLEIIVAKDWAPAPNEPTENRGMIYVWDWNGSEVWKKQTVGYSFSSPTIGDINDDGKNEIIVGFNWWGPHPEEYGIYVYDHEGNILEGWPQLQGKKVWSNPVLGDFDGDKQLEIVVSPWTGTSTYPYGRTYMFESNGSLVEGWPQNMWWIDYFSPIIGDITGDGIPDVLTNTNFIDGNCSIYAWNHSGGLIDGFPKITGGSTEIPSTLSDIDNDGSLELISASWGRLSNETWLLEGTVYVWELNKPLINSTMQWPIFKHDLHQSGLYSNTLGLAVYAGGPYEGEVGEEIKFEGLVTGGTPPYTYHWDFGDGNNASVEDPVHSYSSPGVYTVWFNATDNTSEACDSTIVTITEPPQVAELEITSISGFLGVNVVITNIGEVVATNIEWNISISGGILDLVDVKEVGETNELAVDSTVEVKTGMFFGFGKINTNIDVDAENADKVEGNYSAFLFGPIILGITEE